MALKRFQVDIRTKTISNLLPLNGQFGVVPNQYFFLLSLIVQIPWWTIGFIGTVNHESNLQHSSQKWGRIGLMKHDFWYGGYILAASWTINFTNLTAICIFPFWGHKHGCEPWQHSLPSEHQSWATQPKEICHVWILNYYQLNIDLYALHAGLYRCLPQTLHKTLSVHT